MGGNGKYQLRASLTGSPSIIPAKKPHPKQIKSKQTNKQTEKSKHIWTGEQSWNKNHADESLDRLRKADSGLATTGGHYQTLSNKVHGLICAHHSYTSSPHNSFKSPQDCFSILYQTNIHTNWKGSSGERQTLSFRCVSIFKPWPLPLLFYSTEALECLPILSEEHFVGLFPCH